MIDFDEREEETGLMRLKTEITEIDFDD